MHAGLTRFALAIGCLALAVTGPLVALSTTNEAARPPVLTLPGAGPGTGLFPAVWTAQWTGLATIVGVLLPMACIGVAVYLLARRPCSANGTPDDDS
jgi:hypothetical protein